MKRKINKKNTLLLIIMLLLFMTSIISLYRIITYLKDNRDNKKIQETIIKNSITIIAPTKEKEDIQYNVDFNSLKETNEDTVAYLKVNGTNIDYVVVKGKVNEKKLGEYKIVYHVKASVFHKKVIRIIQVKDQKKPNMNY